MRSNRDEAGLTLLEVAMASVIIAVIMGVAYPVLFTGTDTYGTGMATGDLERHANRVLDGIAEQLAEAGGTTVSPGHLPPVSSSWTSFAKSQGVSGGSIQWGPTQLVYWTPDPEDPDDGKDNDGDGFVDEGHVIWARDVGTAGEQRVVLARDVAEYLEGEEPNGSDDNGNGLVDERGLCFCRDGGVLTIRLTLQRRTAKGRVMTRTVETSMRPRN
jgi:prepilin-type N-terminal cleavage/methylation domain-containing protein